MDSVFSSIAVYLFVLVVFRISGKRSLSQITTFDFILLLIIGEATQQALLGNDFSVINAFVVIATLTTLEVVFSWMGRSHAGVWSRHGGPAGRPRGTRQTVARARESGGRDADGNPCCGA